MDRATLERERWRLGALVRAWKAEGLPIGEWRVELVEDDTGARLEATFRCPRCPISARALRAYLESEAGWWWIPHPPCHCLDPLKGDLPPKVKARYEMELLAGG